MRYKYTEEDIQFLKYYYPNGEWDKIFQRFPTITKSSIHKKCHRIGIVSNNIHQKNFNISQTRRKWTENEVAILIQNYTKKPMNEVMRLLPNRTKDMIQTKAKTLKLVSYNKQVSIWKKDEIKFIQENWELMPDKIMAQQLNRTFRAVKAKREELGFFRKNCNDISYPTLSKYLRGQNQKWKNESLKSCNYKCVLTDSKDFEIHHLYGVSNIINDIFKEYPKYKNLAFNEYTIKDLSFVLSKFLEVQALYPLGVCVDKKLHTLFHSMYGQYYNTPEQWYKFCEDYKMGIYNKYV